MNLFHNKVVWITGASSGIGEALAIAFGKRGAKLVLSSRRLAELQRVKTTLALPDDRIFILPLDLSDTTQIDTLTQQVIQRFGQIDILVNNGGISQRALTKDAPISIDRKIMEVNFFGTVALTKSVLPYFLKQQSGQIVVISSISGKFGFYFRSAYSASKHALHGFFESLRMEVDKDHIKVLMVCPGKVKTNISVNAVTGSGEKHNKMDPSTETGLSAQACAEQIIKGIEKEKEEIFIGGKELRAVWIKRLFPSLFSKLIKKQKAE
ncbi:MAG TPA: SDR family oxidoreductase [Bacteroidia bacterium]|jgi:short-subunit dehydrogenase|nr:SDR family oxidoreductase [Bacteroidia bacterium]